MSQNSDNVRDFSQIKSKKNQRVEMQQPSSKPLDNTLSMNTIQREERQNLLTSNGDGDDNLTDFEDEDDFRDNRSGGRKISEGGTTPGQEKTELQKHWLWGNWILLAMLAMLCFSSCNLIIGELSQMGMESVHYFCSGSLLFSIMYFTY